MLKRITSRAALTVAALATTILAITPAASIPVMAASRVPAIRVVGWRAAQYQMRHGAWCWRLRPGRFACTRLPEPYVIIGPVTGLNGPAGLLWFLRHDFACSGEAWHPGWWDCTPH